MIYKKNKENNLTNPESGRFVANRPTLLHSLLFILLVFNGEFITFKLDWTDDSFSYAFWDLCDNESVFFTLQRDDLLTWIIFMAF